MIQLEDLSGILPCKVSMLYTPEDYIEPENDGLEHVFPFPRGVFSGSILIFPGVTLKILTLLTCAGTRSEPQTVSHTEVEAHGVQSIVGCLGQPKHLQSPARERFAATKCLTTVFQGSLYLTVGPGKFSWKLKYTPGKENHLPNIFVRFLYESSGV